MWGYEIISYIHYFGFEILNSEVCKLNQPTDLNYIFCKSFYNFVNNGINGTGGKCKILRLRTHKLHLKNPIKCNYSAV